MNSTNPYYIRNKEKYLAQARQWKRDNKERYQAYKRKYEAEHPERRQRYNRRAYVKLRVLTLDAYGGKCACCGLDDLAFLTLDHIRRNGQEHRRNTGDGSGFYQWLKKNGFPKDQDLQVLCMNCNWAKGMSLTNECPHKTGESPRYIPPLLPLH